MISSLQKNSPLRWIPLWIVVGWTIISAFAFVNIFNHKHTYEGASEWIYQNIKPGSKLLEPHWDDTLPIHMPDHSPSEFQCHNQQWELGLYEPDTPAKLEQLVTKLASGDYIIFATQRLHGSIMRVPEEYQATTNFFGLLFQGALGYKLVYSYKVEPYLGPIHFDDDLADESFTVYDHPKAMVFQNTGRLSAEELRNRIINPYAFAPLMSREEMMEMDAASTHTGTAASSDSSLWAFIVWLTVFELLSCALAPVIAYALPNFPDKGYGLSKVLGFLTFGYLSWILPSLGIIPADRRTTLIILLGILGVGCLLKKRCSGCASNTHHRAHFRTVEILFIGGLVAFALIRSMTPEIFWGEKPMDFSMLNFFTRNEHFPPQDPWASDQQMRYYYLGTYFFSAILKLTGIDTAIGYNLALATLPALMLAAAYSIMLLICKRRGLAFMGACITVLLSNLEVMNLAISSLYKANYDFSQARINFDLFWASSRIFTSPGITEYPIWSFIFADLHAHVISLPFTLLLIGLGLRLTRKNNTFFDGPDILHRILYGTTLGCLVALNSWDFISYCIVTGFLMLYRPISTPHGAAVPWHKKLIAHVQELFCDGLFIGFVAFAAVSPFLLSSKTTEAISWGWVHDSEFDTTSQVIRHLGIWAIIVLMGLITALPTAFCNRAPTLCRTLLRIAASGAVASLPLLLGVLSSLQGVRKMPWGILFLASILAGLATATYWGKRQNGMAGRTIGALITAAAMLIAGAEMLFLMDHMNTIFKFYNAIWVLLSISAVSMLRYFWYLWRRHPLGKLGRRLLHVPVGIVCLLLLIGAAGSLTNVGIMTSFQRISDAPRFTLDGIAYLPYANPAEAEALKWMREHIGGTPVLLEAHGPSYQHYTRVTMHTGLPTVLGWDHHVHQRGTPEREIEQRKLDIQSIYNSPLAETAEALLNKYHVELIMVGKVEADMYAPEGLKKFDLHPELFPLLYRKGATSIYTRAAALRAPGAVHDLEVSWR